ncbi:maleylpyruvate isomerase family mycothiol-dependent enzyme [Amycolatopsis sp. NPDC098790]|uniref:maleylpyruvate isomerase family mycothiol-dependent enzyme n=1 Tax=Amycolatopsis sp. NPDC098790 TaxID=3363939 RepID=UPI00381DE435
MADVHTDLETEADALADLVRAVEPTVLLPVARAIITQLAELTVVARRIVLGIEGFHGTAAPRIVDTGILGDAVTAWRSEHAKATDLLAARQEDIPWPGGPLRPGVLAAAQLTALFARGQDIADAAGVRITRNDSVGHVAYYGIRTRDEVYAGRREPPAEPFRFVLTAPSGEVWRFGPPDAAERITGPAADFCLLFTGRRPIAELAVTATGAEAREWLRLAGARRDPLWTSEAD